MAYGDFVVDSGRSSRRCRWHSSFPDPEIEVLAKLEMVNPFGSMKDRPARFIVEQGLRTGTLCPGMRLVESTSGNLGVALAVAVKLHGLAFTAVVDPNTSPTNLRLLELFGADIEMVTELDDAGGHLHTRIRRARQLAETLTDTMWVNQYANTLNWRAYYETLGGEILDAVDEPIDYLVAAVSTTGSLHGTARRLRETHPRLQVIAVDAKGSVIFGGPPAPRRIPGFGASRAPSRGRDRPGHRGQRCRVDRRLPAVGRDRGCSPARTSRGEGVDLHRSGDVGGRDDADQPVRF